MIYGVWLPLDAIRGVFRVELALGSRAVWAGSHEAALPPREPKCSLFAIAGCGHRLEPAYSSMEG